MMKTGLIAAMQKEFELFASLLQQPRTQKLRHFEFVEGGLNGRQIVLMLSGIGKVNAAAATVEMINRFAPDNIINSGIAGGLDPKLSVMDVVLGESAAYHDVWCGVGNEYGQVQGLPVRFDGDKRLLDKALRSFSDTAVHKGLIVSGDQFISEPRELEFIKKHFPEALAVDMESAAIAQVCYLYQTPFLALRIISDTPGIENHYRQYQDFWQQAPEKSLEIVRQLLS